MIALSRFSPRIPERAGAGIWPALAAVMLISLYPLLRYGGSWNIGGDTVNFVITIRSVLDTGELDPSGRQVYPNGYGFQALSVFLVHVSGISLPDWQVFGAALLVVWMVFPAWLLYREWVGSGRGATLATVILFTQPELLFGIMRGTHEKFTRGLMLLCLYLLTYSLRSRNNPRRFASAVLAFYLGTYALVSFNNFFSTSFITAVLIALMMVWVVAWRTKSFSSLSIAVQRLSHVVFASLIIAFVYTMYVYGPARENLLLLESIADKIAALFLQAETSESFNPYSTPVFQEWISPYVYFMLTLANWTMLLFSGAIWLSQSFTWFVRRRRPDHETDVLMWAFYGAFTLQVALAVVADISGALTGNLQHRMFPTIGMVGAPLIARWLLSVIRTERVVTARLARSAIWATIAVMASLSLMKATNEPVLSNRWQTYLPAEVEAVEWADTTLARRTVWTGYDRRLIEVIDTRSGAEPRRVALDRLEVNPDTDNFLISELTRIQSHRYDIALPTRFDDFVTYDNGEVQIYHERPRTPYNR
jgi:hypothetical protein